jgi:hypothetical protein
MKNALLLLALAALSSHAALIPPSAPWEKTGTRSGIELFKRETPGSDIIELKGVGVIEAPLWKVASALLDTERAPEWVDSLEKSVLVRRLDPLTYIEYNHFGTPFFLADRDFVSLVKIQIDTEKKTFTLVYEPSEEPVPTLNHVRGIVSPGIFRLTAIEPDRTLLDGEVLCDPKGGIPKWLVNIFQSDWAHDTILALRKQTAKSDIRTPAEFEEVLLKTRQF